MYFTFLSSVPACFVSLKSWNDGIVHCLPVHMLFLCFHTLTILQCVIHLAYFDVQIELQCDFILSSRFRLWFFNIRTRLRWELFKMNLQEIGPEFSAIRLLCRVSCGHVWCRCLNLQPLILRCWIVQPNAALLYIVWVFLRPLCGFLIRLANIHKEAMEQ